MPAPTITCWDCGRVVPATFDRNDPGGITAYKATCCGHSYVGFAIPPARRSPPAFDQDKQDLIDFLKEAGSLPGGTAEVP